MITIKSIAKELKLDTNYVRRLVRDLGIKPKESCGSANIFTKSDVQTIRNRPIGKAGRPKK